MYDEYATVLDSCVRVIRYVSARGEPGMLRPKRAECDSGSGGAVAGVAYDVLMSCSRVKTCHAPNIILC